MNSQPLDIFKRYGRAYETTNKGSRTIELEYWKFCVNAVLGEDKYFWEIKK